MVGETCSRGAIEWYCNCITCRLLLQLKGNNIGKKRKADEMDDGLNANDDTCLDHVIGSAAEVEHLWSMARYTLTTNRSIMSPIVFEAISFLHMNHVLWDERTVMWKHLQRSGPTRKMSVCKEN